MFKRLVLHLLLVVALLAGSLAPVQAAGMVDMAEDSMGMAHGEDCPGIAQDSATPCPMQEQGMDCCGKHITCTPLMAVPLAAWSQDWPAAASTYGPVQQSHAKGADPFAETPPPKA